MADRIQIIFENNHWWQINTFDHSFAHKWTTYFFHCVNIIGQKYELNVTGDDLYKTQRRLRDIIDQVNLHVPSTINQNIDYLSFKTLSDIHYIYEGISKNDYWVSNGSLSLEKAIKIRDELNDAIHEAEGLIGKRVCPRIRYRLVNSDTGVPNLPKVEFEECDYNYFEPIMEPYVVYLNYNAVGEDLLKTYKSGRSIDSAVNLRQFSPSFFFVTHAVDYELQKHDVEQTYKWMENNGIDINDKKNIVGYLPIGRLFKNMPDASFINDVRHSRIKEIKVR